MQSVQIKVELAFWVTRNPTLARELAISENLIAETRTEAPSSGRVHSTVTLQTGVLVGWEWPSA